MRSSRKDLHVEQLWNRHEVARIREVYAFVTLAMFVETFLQFFVCDGTRFTPDYVMMDALLKVVRKIVFIPDKTTSVSSRLHGEEQPTIVRFQLVPTLHNQFLFTEN
eukprot:m.112079 g.112079  ORF g.112079 m.112079 type:complete len:107 (+) comp17029_c0_seq2:256-576(+)